MDERAIRLRASETAARIRARRLIAILRRVSPPEALLGLVDELVEAGVRVFEITFDAEAAAADLEAVRARLSTTGDDACLVGGGTIRTVDQLRAANQAGAQFGVAPVLDLGVLQRAIDIGLPFVPAAYTPTEIDLAWRSGATFVKLFPASSLGPDHVRELRGPMPEIETIVTGGVNWDNARAFLAAGAVAVGIGSALVKADREARVEIVAAVTP